jgi:hypothetical protein
VDPSDPLQITNIVSQTSVLAFLYKVSSALVKDTHRASPLSPGCLLVQGIKLFTQPSPRDRAFFATGLDAGDREPGRYCEADRGGFAARHAPVRVCQGGCPHAPCHAMPHVGCTGRERSRLAAAGGIPEHRRGRASAHPAGRVRTPADPNNLCRGSRVRAVRHTEPSDRPSPPSPPSPSGDGQRAGGTVSDGQERSEQRGHC